MVYIMQVCKLLLKIKKEWGQVKNQVGSPKANSAVCTDLYISMAMQKPDRVDICSGVSCESLLTSLLFGGSLCPEEKDFIL